MKRETKAEAASRRQLLARQSRVFCQRLEHGPHDARVATAAVRAVEAALEPSHQAQATSTVRV
jgi:hypothetical protein